ncbi:MAG: LPS export ABC transporter periplasmic protein LptC [Thermoanaerobaculia bacterium]
MSARPRSHTARLRRGILIALLVLGAALTGLYLLGRQGRSPEPVVETPAATPPAEEGVVASSDAFDFTQTIEGQPVFRLHGDRFTTGRDALVELTGVQLELFRDAVRYSVAADRASYDPNTKGAVLLGKVRLSGQDGFELASERMSLERGGQWISAAGPVQLAQSGRFRGSSGELTFDLATDFLRLNGPVRLESAAPGVEPLVFETSRIEYDRSGRLVKFPDVFYVTRAESRMQAGNGELFLTEGESAPALLSLRGGVVGSLPQPPAVEAGERKILVQATRLSLRFASDSASEPEEATLDGHGRDLALIESVGAKDDLIQGLAARGWVIRFANGKPTEAESSAPVHFAEYHRGVEEAVRSGRADSGRAEISSAGTVDRIALNGGVQLDDPKFHAVGARALFDVGGDRAEILGPNARVTTDRGDLSAPHLIYSRATGLLTGSDGVRAVLRDEADSSLSGLGWKGKEPIQVESREATLQNDPRSFSFTSGVRAWQGRNLLLAEQLRGDEATGQLAAANAVRTVWYPTRDPAKGESAAVPPSEDPVEVTAKTMTYRREEGRLVYEGDVRVKRGSRSFRCDRLTSDLDRENQLEKMIGEGAVRLDDPDGGRVIEGQKAEYSVASGELLVSGSPVRMKDAQGAELKGRRLLYNMESGAARLLGAGN